MDLEPGLLRVVQHLGLHAVLLVTASTLPHCRLVAPCTRHVDHKRETLAGIPRGGMLSADCYVVAPASADYVAKLATGIADNQALTQVSDAIGTLGVTVVVFPLVNAAHVRHPAWESHIESLQKGDLERVHGPEVWPLYEPREGPTARELPWGMILDAVDRVALRS
ncbi:flavoprotein [Streptomyces sp. 8N616]|uniref:flavoprotein n=1 Tax=Streptomyces sp. 8N616 TaxID=3457414 RepID=UPI003FD63BDA